MQFNSFSPEAGLLLLNVVAASLLLSFVAIVAAFLVRRGSLSLRHGLLCVALVLALASPIPIWVASHEGIGVISVPVASKSVARSVDEWKPTPDEESGHRKLSDQLLREVDRDGNREATASEPSARPSASAPSTEPLAPVDAAVTPILRGNTSSSSHFWSPGSVNPQLVGRVGLCLALVWAGVTAWFLLRLVRGLWVIRQLHISLRLVTDRRVIDAAKKVVGGKHHGASVYESSIAPAPLTLGWWRSVIVMPEGLAELLDDQELDCVLAHEAAHVARHDTAIAMLQQLSGIGFWWNPLLRVINRQIDQLRERICDDRVVTELGDGLPLARALVKVAEWSATHEVVTPLASTLLDDEDQIEQRITRLTDRNRTISVGLSASSISLIGLFGVVLATVAILPVVRAQTSAPATAKPRAKAAAPQAGWQVRVRATDTDGKPIASPRIGVWLGGKSERRWYDGDRDGWCTVTVPKRTPGYCYLMARAERYAPMRAFWSNAKNKPEDALPAEFTFEMTEAMTVGGVVVDEDNQPVEGATVLFSGGDDVNPARRAKVSFSQERYTTDEMGHWRCKLAPVTLSSATINVSHSDYAIDHGNYSQDSRIEELRRRTHVWTLKAGFVVTGRVVDAAGDPIAGATLALCELNTSSHEGPFEKTDADGRYRFERVSPRFSLPSDDDPIRFTISIVKPGYAPILQSVPGYGKRPLGDSTERERIVNFTLRQGVSLKLRVVDSDDEPIQGAWVLPDNWRDTTALRVLQQFGIPRETDKEGVWEWKNAPLGEEIGYDVMKRGFADVRDHEIQVTDQAVEETIVLRRPQIITGTVIDAETRMPIAEFVVERAFEGMAGYPDGLSWTSQQTRGKNGKYRKRVTMPPNNGSYTYRVLAEGYKPAISKSTRFTEGETKVNFELQREETRKDAAAKADAKTNADKVKEAREARLAKVEPEFSKVYRLGEKEVLRHIPEPLDRELRSRWYRAVFGRPQSNKMEILTLYLQWKDARPQWKGAAIGFSKGGMPIRDVLMMLNAVSPQYIEGDQGLLNRKIPGDWVFDPKAPADEIVAAMQPVLQKEWGVPVKLTFREVERDVYVARGRWDFKPISADFPDVQIYGTFLDKDSGSGGATGNFDKFLRAAGSWIGMPIVNEATEPPKKRFSWSYHMPSPFTDQQQAESHDPESVTANLASQTGLEFVKERRQTRVLFVEE